MPEYVDHYPRGIGHLAGDLTALRAWARASDIDKSAFAYRDGMIFLGASADGTLLGLDAVSYTHLDVYKRQVPPSVTSTAGAASCRRPRAGGSRSETGC